MSSAIAARSTGETAFAPAIGGTYSTGASSVCFDPAAFGSAFAGLTDSRSTTGFGSVFGSYAG
jgi:hypothetical protein|nr:hypothetical protein Q903MT_gene585 [Picea sitchensis]